MVGLRSSAALVGAVITVALVGGCAGVPAPRVPAPRVAGTVRYTLAHGTRTFESGQTHLSELRPDAGALSADAALAAISNAAGRGLSRPALEFGSYTDTNDVQTLRNGIKPYGLINRRVWIGMYASVPLRLRPPVGGSSLRTREAAEAGATVFVLEVVDGYTGKALEEIDMPRNSVT